MALNHFNPNHFGSGHFDASHFKVTVVVRLSSGGMSKRQKLVRIEEYNRQQILQQLVKEDEELIMMIVKLVTEL